MAALDVRPIAGALGAEIHGINLASELDSGTVAAIRRAIFFRDQELPPERFLAFARRLGTPVEYPLVKGIDGYPEIIRVAKLEDETVNFGGIWHSDTTYLEAPPMGTMLVAREVPPIGGDTLFATAPPSRPTRRGRARTASNPIRPRSRGTNSSPNIRWCAPIRRPGARRSTSMSRTPCASPA